MYIAMNRFRIRKGREADFEELWRTRDSRLAEVPGFRSFHLLRGPTGDEATTYVSHSTWESEAAFQAWTESESFRAAHADARPSEGTVIGPPVFEGYEVVL